MKHIRENGSLKSEAAPNQEAAYDRNRGRDMRVGEGWCGGRFRGPGVIRREGGGRGRDSELSMQMLTQNVTSMSPHNRRRLRSSSRSSYHPSSPPVNRRPVVLDDTAAMQIAMLHNT